MLWLKNYLHSSLSILFQLTFLNAMKIQDLKGKKVLILGFGREGQATLEVLRKKMPDQEFVIADTNEVASVQLILLRMQRNWLCRKKIHFLPLAAVLVREKQ